MLQRLSMYFIFVCILALSQNWSEPFLSDDLINKLLNHSGDSDDDIVNDRDICAYPDWDTMDSELEPLKCNNYEAEDNIPDILDIPLSLPIAFDPDFDLF